MIPIRNRKKTLQVTVEEMRNFAFAYVEKYAPSKQQLKIYLFKKLIKINQKKIDLENTRKLKSFELTNVVSSVQQLKKVLYKKKNV